MCKDSFLLKEGPGIKCLLAFKSSKGQLMASSVRKQPHINFALGACPS